MGTYPPRFAAVPRGWPGGKLLPRAGSVGPSQTSITQWDRGFHTLRGGIDPGDLRFCPGVVGAVGILLNFSSGDENLISPVAAGPRGLPGGQLSPRARHMGPIQSSITQWRWVSTPCGAVSTGGSAFSSPFFFGYRDMERFQIWRWNLILPGCRETSALARGATLAAG